MTTADDGSRSVPPAPGSGADGAPDPGRPLGPTAGPGDGTLYDWPQDEPPEPELSLDDTLDRNRALAVTVCLVAGLAVGVIGTVVHRAAPPWGLVTVVATALSAAVLARALAGGLGLAVYSGALLVVTQLMAQLRPGGDAIVAADAVGYGWLVGAVAACAVAAFLPARWFGSAGGRAR